MIHRNLGRDQNQSHEDHPSGPESAGIIDREGDKRMDYRETRKRKKGQSVGWESEPRETPTQKVSESSLFGDSGNLVYRQKELSRH